MTNTDEQFYTDDHTEEVLSPGNALAGTPLETVEDIPLAIFESEEEFATFIAETVSGTAVAMGNMSPDQAIEFRVKYVAFVTPWLKFGGFMQLAPNLTIGGFVKRHPWIGSIICAGACILGVVFLWPRDESETDKMESTPFGEVGEEDGA